jgi:F-type H+-transporting ATPase subunit alpha
MEEQAIVIYAGTRGYLDGVPVGDVGRYEAELLTHVRSSQASLLTKIREEAALTDDIENEIKSVLDSFTEKFA